MSLTRRQVILTSFLASCTSAAGHGMLLHPPSRNAVDRSLPEFVDGKWPQNGDGCNCASTEGGCVAASARPNGNGQPCLWFSQGCAIGCPSCTSLHGHTNTSLCKNPTTGPTINDPKLRTMNIKAKAGSAEDVYMYNPWRAPGSAPVTDACGMAGGSPHPVAQDAALFVNTSFARQGELGSQVLKPAPSGTVWSPGSTVEVVWGIRYNHGGGYSYRLCPANEPLTEECFQRMPLNFTGMPSLRWNDGKEMWYKGVYVTEGTHPPGSMWARNPIPRIDDWPGDSGEPADDTWCQLPSKGIGCRAFNPVCEEENSTRPWHPIDPAARPSDVEGFCSGDWTGGVLVDRIQIPTSLKPGEYVLGWRWDCEETAQIWQNCADVTIAPPIVV